MELGAFICIECAAVHRRLGSTISQVRSIQLDAWEAQQVEVRSVQLPLPRRMRANATVPTRMLILIAGVVTQFLKQNGNLKVNTWWEGRRMEGITKPAPPMISEGEREKYIRLKYEKKFFTKDCLMLSIEEALASEDAKQKAVRAVLPS
jgi:hypothetical protein